MGRMALLTLFLLAAQPAQAQTAWDLGKQAVGGAAAGKLEKQITGTPAARGESSAFRRSPPPQHLAAVPSATNQKAPRYSAEMSISSVRISMHVVAYSLALFRSLPAIIVQPFRCPGRK